MYSHLSATITSSVTLEKLKERAKKRGIEPGSCIGKGAYALVYETQDPTKVIKFTRDKTDAVASFYTKRDKLWLNPSLSVPIIYGVYQGPNHMYAIWMERLEPMEYPIDFVHELKPFINFIWTIESSSNPKTQKIMNTFRYFANTYELYLNDIHPGNFMQSPQTGNIVYCDLGYYKNMEKARTKRLTKFA